MVIEPLTRAHDRAAFDCGVPAMNEFLARYARQNDAQGLSRTYAAVDDVGSSRILGYYTLSNGSVTFENLPQERLPRYPVPTALLGRLAVDTSCQGRGLGKRLLVDTLRRVELVSEQMGVFAVEVTALDESAAGFYAKFGFQRLADDDLHLYLSMKTVRALGLVDQESRL